MNCIGESNLTVYKSDQITNVASMKVFLDANILISLEPFFPNPSKYIQSSNSFKIFLAKNTSLFTDVITLSEFYNRWLRIAYKSYLTENKLSSRQCSFKSYRTTPDGVYTINQICTSIQSILQYVDIRNPNYSENVFAANIISNNLINLDFNDFHIVSVCSHNNFCLWTNDIDFKGQNIDIYSENRNY